MLRTNKPFPHFGLGLRAPHFKTVLATQPKDIDWFEILSENYMVEGGETLYYLDQIKERYPLAMHGVSLSIGSTDPLNKNYLTKLKQLIDRVDPLWVSDHFCWTGIEQVNMHDLMPLPYTEECIDHLVTRIKHVQGFLERRMLLENISSYIECDDNEMTEWQFISEVAGRADCDLLLDVNNIYVNAFNHGFDADDFIKGVPVERVKEFHIGGHDNKGTHIIDTHDAKIVVPVWELYKKAQQRFPLAATLVERDANIPPLQELIDELNYAREIVTASER